MKSIIIRKALAGLLVISCAPDESSINDFNPDPLKQAFIKNEVVSYISIVKSAWLTEKRDTVVLDSRGNIVSINNIGGIHYVQKLRYDSLDRLVYSFQESDIKNIVKFTYTSPTNWIQIKTEFLCYRDEDPGDMVYQTITELDQKSLKPINRTEIHLTDPDTTEYIYIYDQSKLLKEIQLPEKDSVYTRYYYSDDRLVKKMSVMAWDSFYMSIEDFFSPQSGLRDSTREFDGEFLTSTYYQYYFRDR